MSQLIRWQLGCVIFSWLLQLQNSKGYFHTLWNSHRNVRSKDRTWWLWLPFISTSAGWPWHSRNDLIYVRCYNDKSIDTKGNITVRDRGGMINRQRVGWLPSLYDEDIKWVHWKRRGSGLIWGGIHMKKID